MIILKRKEKGLCKLFIPLPEYHVDAGDDKKEEEPEPECNVDLVIDHVDGKDTEAIKSEIQL